MLEALSSAGQEHLLRHLDALSPVQAEAFSRELRSVDWPRAASMHREAGPHAVASAALSGIRPARARIPGAREKSSLRGRGMELLAQGKAGFVLMAGGQGSRLGYEGPKGACPIGLPDGVVLFEILVRRLFRLGELCGKLPPFSVMTGPDNHEATAGWFRDRRPALPSGWPKLFLQSSAPALDDAGRALLAAPGRLALVPDGNGGIWERLEASGVLDSWADTGVEWIHVAGVDNVLSLPCDPTFLGFAEAAGSPLSCKTVLRTDPAEKVGVYARDDQGRPRVAEYTELPSSTAAALDVDGLPVHREANIASHLVRIDLARKFAKQPLPWHLARKKIPHVHPETGADLSGEQGCKYERFLFDAFPSAEGMSLLRVERADEFAPVKNAEGADSPATARTALENLHRRWRSAWGREGSEWIDPSESYDGEPPTGRPSRS
jgi:UDP-N-acetylglucosamine/UDP-N-acetylgalactosamine diphosphorylase